MDIFEYLPQLIVAYDGNDEFANLIHVKKANRDSDYFCPCCGGTVKPRALDSTKEQSHYYHVTGKCTKESQLHFFCKNWLFEKGSKFYVDNKLFEVESIEIEKHYDTPFGEYIPDVTVHTTIDKDIYFEMFFTNRKTGDDYFCKWDYLGNDVVEINIKEYMFKTDENSIPSFTYLYHDGVCYSKPYIKRDLYANTIARIKHELTRQKVLNYKARIEQLDWFWQEIRNNKSKEELLNVISEMEYDDMVSCYEIIKRKQCVSYLKNDVLEIINQKVISEVRNSLDLPYDENVYFDLKHIRGRTYEAGIRLNIKTNHIIYNNFYLCCSECLFNQLKGYPKIVFNKNIHDSKEIDITEGVIADLKSKFEETVKYKNKIIENEKVLSDFEGKNYKIRVKDNLYTVLGKIYGEDFEVILENYYMKEFDITKLSKEIQLKIKEIKDKNFINTTLKSEKYQSLFFELQNYKKYIEHNVDIEYCYSCHSSRKSGVYFKLIVGKNNCVYNQILQLSFEDFIRKINDCKKIIDDFEDNHNIVMKLVEEINNCKNNLWKAKVLFDDYKGCPTIEVDQKYFVPKKHLTFEKMHFHVCENKETIIKRFEIAMYRVLKNMEICGYRVIWRGETNEE